jgi:hypothetical protein
VTSVPAAVGARCGSVELYWDPFSTNDPLASLQPEHPLGREAVEQCTVPIVTLDDWVRSVGLDRVDLVKVDVEQSEPEVLDGMQTLLEQHRPDVVVEILDERTAEAVARVVATFGYRHLLLTSAGPIATSTIGRHPSCLNHLLTTRDDAELVALWR